MPNTAVQNRKLSLAARGLLADLLSRPDHWREDARQIADSSTDSRAAVRKALRELADAGYYRVERVRQEDGTIRSVAHIFDTPQLPGIREARELLNAVTPQATPHVPRPASGCADSGDAGVPDVKNIVQEPSLPTSSVGAGRAGRARHGEPSGGRAGTSIVGLDAPLRAAALMLHQVAGPVSRLRLGEAEVVRLAPLVARWLDAGLGRAELAEALLPGLPEVIHSPAAVVRNRLLRKLPPDPAPRLAQRHECEDCRAPIPVAGRCVPCGGGPAPKVAVGRGERFTAAGAAGARAAMRSNRRTVASVGA